MSTNVKPAIHLNGSSPEALLEAYEAAYDAIRRARDAHMLTAPNGRDYYVQGDGFYQAAHDEHIARAGALFDAMEDMEALADHVRGEIERRKKR